MIISVYCPVFAGFLVRENGLISLFKTKWWRRRESNSRPKWKKTSLYERSPLINLASCREKNTTQSKKQSIFSIMPDFSDYLSLIYRYQLRAASMNLPNSPTCKNYWVVTSYAASASTKLTLMTFDLPFIVLLVDIGEQRSGSQLGSNDHSVKSKTSPYSI